MNVYEAIKTRKSVRAFLDKDVPEETLQRILAAARLAPSAGNRQEWRFLVVRNAKMRQALANAAGKQLFIAEAPVVLVCCAETDGHVMTCGHVSFLVDVSIAIDHITLCAVAEGLGTCWIGAFKEDEIRNLLELPQNIRVVQLMPLGYPKDPAPKNKSRLPLDTIVKQEQWS